MPARAEIRFAGMDGASRTPSFELELGTNVRFGVELANDYALLEPWNAAARNAANFFHSGLIATAAGGRVPFVVPAPAFRGLSFATGKLHYRVSTFAADNGDRRFSTPYGQAASAPWIATGVPAVASIDPRFATIGVPTTVTIRGTGLSWAYEVIFGSVAAATVRPVSDVELLAEVPTQGNTGIYPVTVRSPFGPSVAMPSSTFEYTSSLPTPPPWPAPEIIDIRVVPAALAELPEHDPERLSEDASEIRRGRPYRVEVVYDRAFNALPHASATVTVAGSAFQFRLQPSPGAGNMAWSDAFVVD